MGASNSKIKLIIGLGNPDGAYKNTYHNIGFLTMDYLNSKLPIPLLKTDVYMNESGKFVKSAIKKYNIKIDQMLIIQDDSDLTLGNYKISFDRGSAGHKGIESIMNILKTKKFWRLRIGIRPLAYTDQRGLIRGPARKKAGEFVLKKITAQHRALLAKTFEKILLELTKAI